MAAKWSLPLLVVLENNLYAQSTSQSETLAGDICARAAAFGIATLHGDTWRYEDLTALLRSAAATVRRDCRPVFVRVDTYRLAAHSKGDDDRDLQEIDRYKRRDPLNRFLADEDTADEPELAAIRAARRARDGAGRASARRSTSHPARGARGAPALSWRQPSPEPARSLRPSTRRCATGSPKTRSSCCSARTSLAVWRRVQGDARLVGRLSRPRVEHAHQRSRHRRYRERPRARRATRRSSRSCSATS